MNKHDNATECQYEVMYDKLKSCETGLK